MCIVGISINVDSNDSVFQIVQFEFNTNAFPLKKYLKLFREKRDVEIKSDFSGVACINPPIPPEETKLELLYEKDTVIAFGDTVSYQCLPGTFFEIDYNMPNFTLTCQTDGNFSDPLPWKNCLLPSSKT